MSWFDKGFASLAKTALIEAQKKIDKALDIRDDDENIATSTNTKDNNERFSKTVPNTPNTETNKHLATSNWGSFTGSFFDSPKSNEQMLVTTAPKVEAIANLTKNSTVTGTVSPTTATNTTAQKINRHSVTSNSDSVDLLSSSDIVTSSEVNVSESIDLITSNITTPEESANCTTDSIVIINNNEVNEDEEDSLTYNTVDDANVTLIPANLGTSLDDSKDLSSCGSLTPRATLSQGSKKLLISKDDVVVDSDSTQSFEDVQMLTSVDMGSSHRDLSLDDKFDLNQMVLTSTTSYSSPHNSNDEIETNTTTTSSDIEIISNPNGDSSSTHSATRICSTRKKKSGNISTTAHSGGMLPLAKKGHCRELSEISVLSEDSQTEIDKLSHRISELTEHLEARESQLLQCEHQNASLQERNNELQAMVDSMRSNNTNLDTSTEDYTQRLSALEKKFQTCIRERDALRIQIKALKDDLHQKVPKDQFDAMTVERDNMISELRQEGEKLSKEVLTQSNIIKKLRSKEKTSEATIKRNTIQIEELTEETERLKKTLNAKEDMERSQIEAVHKISSEKRKLEEDNSLQRSKIEDLEVKLETMQASFEAVKEELQQRTRVHTDLTRKADEAQETSKIVENLKAENSSLYIQIVELKEKLRSSEQVFAHREKQLREENKQLLARVESAELRAETFTEEMSQTTIPLMRQLESLQNTLSQRTVNWNKEEKALIEKLDVSQTRLKSLENIESAFQEKVDLLQARCLELEEKLSNALLQWEEATIALHQSETDFVLKESSLKTELSQIKEALEESKSCIKTLEAQNKSLEESLSKSVNLLSPVNVLKASPTLHSSTDDLFKHKLSTSLQEANEKDRILQQQQQHQLLYTHHSPTNSLGVNSIEEALGCSFDWQADESDCISNSGGRNPLNLMGGINFMGHNTSTIEHLQSLLKQRDGELHHLQWEISRMQSERTVLNEEITNLTLELENLKEKLQINEALETNFNELQHRYDELLQMYGEKVERTEELELDLLESREAYKKQIEELFAQPKSELRKST